MRTLRIFPQETKVDAKPLSLCALTQRPYGSRALSHQFPRAAHRRCFRSCGGVSLCCCFCHLVQISRLRPGSHFLGSSLVLCPCAPGPPALHNPPAAPKRQCDYTHLTLSTGLRYLQLTAKVAGGSSSAGSLAYQQ